MLRRQLGETYPLRAQHGIGQNDDGAQRSGAVAPPRLGWLAGSLADPLSHTSWYDSEPMPGQKPHVCGWGRRECPGCGLGLTERQKASKTGD